MEKVVKELDKKKLYSNLKKIGIKKTLIFIIDKCVEFKFLCNQ